MTTYDKCPICHNNIVADRGLKQSHYWDDNWDPLPYWTEDPLLTPRGLAGENYKGRNPVKAIHIYELQDYYYIAEFAAGLEGDDLTDWLWVAPSVPPNSLYQDGVNAPIRNVHIEQLRMSVEKILDAKGYDLTYYFTHTRLGDEIESPQTDWTDVDRSNGYPALPRGYPVRAIHIEELRKGIPPFPWKETWNPIDGNPEIQKVLVSTLPPFSAAKFELIDLLEAHYGDQHWTNTNLWLRAATSQSDYAGAGSAEASVTGRLAIEGGDITKKYIWESAFDLSATKTTGFAYTESLGQMRQTHPNSFKSNIGQLIDSGTMIRVSGNFIESGEHTGDLTSDTKKRTCGVVLALSMTSPDGPDLDLVYCEKSLNSGSIPYTDEAIFVSWTSMQRNIYQDLSNVLAEHYGVTIEGKSYTLATIGIKYYHEMRLREFNTHSTSVAVSNCRLEIDDIFITN